MRRFIALLVLGTPILVTQASAWEFTPGTPCRLTHAEPGLELELTHDPFAPLYTITLRREVPWPRAPYFSITFEGGQTITTNRHILIDNDHALTVKDRGFGNVLAGMANSPNAMAQTGLVSEKFNLSGAAAPTQAFEACGSVPAA